MAFSIKNEQADHLVRQVSMLTGESLTDAVIVSLEERLERLRARPEVVDRRRLLQEIVDSFQQNLALAKADPNLDPNFELEWDEFGLPI